MARRTLSYTVLQAYHHQKRRDPQTPPLDLSECDLSGFDLRDLDLSSANLRKSDLTGTLLGNTKLDQTTLFQTRFADLQLRSLLEAGIEPVALLEQHRGATYYLFRLFHFSSNPEHTQTFTLSHEECMQICQVNTDLLWQDLDDQVVIRMLYPGSTWENWMAHMVNRAALDWVMQDQERISLLREASARNWLSPAALSRILDATSDPEELFHEALLAKIRHAIKRQEEREYQRQQREEEEARWRAEPVLYPPAPWKDGPSVTNIRSRQELVAVLQNASRVPISRGDILRYENGCLGRHAFLYFVGEPASRGSIVQMLPDGNVWGITHPESDLSPLVAWLKAQGVFHDDLSPMGRACNLLAQAGIATVIYQIYWYCDEDQIDVQSCRDKDGKEVSTDNTAISRAHWLLHYEQEADRYYGQYALLVAEKRLTRLGAAHLPETEDEDSELFQGGE